MYNRTPSRNSLKIRIHTLRRRHRALDARITRRESQPSADMQDIKQLKQERLGLRDAIRLAQSLLMQLETRNADVGWSTHAQSG